jgi:hypothetical protein
MTARASHGVAWSATDSAIHDAYSGQGWFVPAWLETEQVSQLGIRRTSRRAHLLCD